jgi:hypothetical protein
METPAPDPAKLLQSWMEWERGDATPGRVMANLKTGGMRKLLEDLAAPPQTAEGTEGAHGPEQEPGGALGATPPSWVPTA